MPRKICPETFLKDQAGEPLSKSIFRFLVVVGILLGSGCSLLPQVGRLPVLHNPFPQVTRVAVAPFFNLSEEPKVDGRQFALAYYNALQSVPGFEVIPVGQVERAMRDNNIGLNSPEEARRLAQMLGADALVVGAVTDYSPYYPPRCGLRVEWYAANPHLGPIPPGQHPLSSGAENTNQECCTTEESVFEAQGVLAGGELKNRPSAGGAGAWADPHIQTELPPQPEDTSSPIMTHTRIYNGHDVEFTAALSRYHLTRDDARFGGWQTYLERSDDFIRFCCYKHLEEMLMLRGGATETKVLWRWPAIR